MLFVTRLHKDTDVNDISDHIKNLIKNKDVKCEALRTKHDSYVSLKVTIPMTCKDVVSCTSNWPSGVLVRKLFPKKL